MTPNGGGEPLPYMLRFRRSVSDVGTTYRRAATRGRPYRQEGKVPRFAVGAGASPALRVDDIRPYESRRERPGTISYALMAAHVRRLTVGGSRPFTCPRAAAGGFEPRRLTERRIQRQSSPRS